MINSATSYGDPSMFGNMQIGKWLKVDDNALVNDSTVNIVDGKVKPGDDTEAPKCRIERIRSRT